MERRGIFNPEEWYRLPKHWRAFWMAYDQVTAEMRIWEEAEAERRSKPGPAGGSSEAVW